MGDVNMTAIEEFRVEVLMNLATGDFPLDIVDERGEMPVVVALDEEPLEVLMRRVANTGGYANVFAKGEHAIRQASVLRRESALYEADADDMTVEAPAGHVTVGAFLDYVRTQEHGVNIPAILPAQAIPATVRDAREVEFVDADT